MEALKNSPVKLIAMIRSLYTLGLATLLLVAGCKSDKKEQPASEPNNPSPPAPEVKVDAPEFSADSAYAFVEKQVAFGPRVPGTPEHKACGDWLVAQGKRLAGDGNVIEQSGRGRLYTGKVIDFRNIIIQFNKSAKQRVLLFAHWDSRLFGDHDPDPTKRKSPILGANDGASGVGVLLEIGRLLKNHPLDNLGVDLVLLDAEDQGTPDNMNVNRNDDSFKTWCLGSQYWSKNVHRNAHFRFGILLDMVGASDAEFPKEGNSVKYASRLTDRVWAIAKKLGYGNYFIDKQGTDILDDHYFINTKTNIPTVDIIHYKGQTGTFGETWHTHDDNMDVIDPKTLKAVGETVTYVVYEESARMKTP